MILNLSDITYYYLTVPKENNIRKAHLLQEFSDLNLIEVNPNISSNKVRSGATGFCKILDLASLNQDKNKPFQPFAIFEDDVKKNRDFPLNIEIPDDSDILYIGVSSCGMKHKNSSHEVCFKNIDEDIIRVYNMLSTHGMIFCSIRGLITYQKSFLECFFNKRGYDIIASQTQPFINAYALKIPLVYQYKELGGLEKETKITYNDLQDKLIPKEWINTNHMSVRTIYNSRWGEIRRFNKRKKK